MIVEGKGKRAETADQTQSSQREKFGKGYRRTIIAALQKKRFPARESEKKGPRRRGIEEVQHNVTVSHLTDDCVMTSKEDLKS